MGASLSSFGFCCKASSSNSVMFERGMTWPSMLTVPGLSHFNRLATFVIQSRSKRRAFGACIFASVESIAFSLSGARVSSISSISRFVSYSAVLSLSRKKDNAVKSVDNLDIFRNHRVRFLSVELRTFHSLIVKNYHQFFVNFFPPHPALLTAFHMISYDSSNNW